MKQKTLNIEARQYFHRVPYVRYSIPPNPILNTRPLFYYVRKSGESFAAPFTIITVPSGVRSSGLDMEFPKIRGTLFGGPYNKDPTI